MSEPKSLATDLQRWKDKFFELQESYDTELKEAEEFKTVLQRLLLRVCLSAEGQSPAFDEELSSLRQAIKAQEISAQSLSTQLTQLDKALATFDEAKADGLESLVSVFEQLVKQLLDLKPPRSLRSQLKKMSKSIALDSFTTDRFVPLLNDYKSIQGSILQSMLEQTDKPPGLIERIFSPEPRLKPGEPAADDKTDFLDIGISDELVEDEVIPGFSAISVHVRATLNNLLDQLTFPESSERALKTLRSRINKTLNWYELGPTLDDVSSVVISAIGKGQRDFGSFLTDIDERLQKIQSFVLETLRADESLRIEEQLLDQQMRDQISHMTHSLENVSDVESLKQSIREQVENISAVLDRFSETGRRLEENKSKEFEAMQLRFKALEEETQFFRKRLKEERSKALTDALTQLPNREAYDERVEMEYERWKRYQKPATLIIADVDHFKSINDNYGHLSGDKVLQILGKEVQSRMRKTDFVARYGGEEFVIILPETDIETAKGVIEKARETISRLPFHFRDEKLQVTLSFGLVAFTEGYDTNELFEMADKALYRAKEAGRNRLEVWAD